MITIKNLNRIVGMSCNGHMIQRVSEASGVRGNFEKYVFHFDNYNSMKMSTTPDIQIHLYRNPESNGNYELFCMGLQAATFVMVSKRDIRNPVELTKHIRVVLQKTEHWFNTK